MAEECKEVQIRNLSEQQKGKLLTEMRRTIRSKLDRTKAQLEAAARKKARKVSGSAEFKGLRSKIQDHLDAKKETIEQLGDAFKAEDKVFLKEQSVLSKEYDKTVAKLDKGYNKSYSSVAKKRSKLGETYDSKMTRARCNASSAIKKVQDRMQSKFGDKLIYVSFDTLKGALMVKAIQLYYDEVRGLVSDNSVIMNAVDKWNAFRVKVFSHPDFGKVQQQFDTLVKNL